MITLEAVVFSPTHPVRSWNTRRAGWIESALAGGIEIPRAFDSEAARRHVAGRTVLVTGASSGIGRALALRLGMLGAKVVLVARSHEVLQQVAAEICEEGGTAWAYAADLKTQAGVAGLLAALARDERQIDVLVNNAGRSIRRSLAQSYARAHDFERTIALNYFAPLHLILGLLPGMRARRCGQILNVSSLAVPFSSPLFSAYVASKAALEAFSRVAAIETLADAVHWSTVYMPLVRTPMSAPTPEFADLPALSPEQAADALIYALLGRRARLATWPSQLTQLGSMLAPNLFNRACSWLYRLAAGEPSADSGRACAGAALSA
jgi:short-subunit dehydrogenase